MKNKIIFSTLMAVALLSIIGTGVFAAIYLQYGCNETTGWGCTKGSTCGGTAGTYNNHLYSRTLGWYIKNNGEEGYKEGPTVVKDNSLQAQSNVDVPTGRGTYYETQQQGTCRRCGDDKAWRTTMHAF